MKSGSLCLLVIATVVGIIECQTANPKPYDCRRPGTVCSNINGGFCETRSNQVVDVGTCVCALGRRGNDCTVSANNIPTICNVNCHLINTQFCYDDGTAVHKCKCLPAFTGTMCNDRRVRTTCTQTYMDVYIRPLADQFAGAVYVRDRSTTECDLALNGNGDFYIQLSLSSNSSINPCGSLISSTTDPTNGNVAYQYRIRVQYDSSISTATDEEHVVTCIHDPNGNVASGIIVNPIGEGVLTGDVVSDAMSVVKMDIIGVDRGRISVVPTVGSTIITLTVGEDLEVQVIVVNPQTYVNHYVENCTAYDKPPTDAARIGKQLILDGCPPNSALNVVRPPLRKNGDTITIPIDAFKFDATSTVYFECAVKVCRLATDTICLPTPTSCTNGGTDSRAGRKKRQSPEDQDFKIEGRFLVVELSAGENPTTHTRNIVTQESCLQSIPFVAMTVVFATLLLLTLVVAIFLCCRHSSRTKQRPVLKYTPDDGFHNGAISKA